MITMPREFKLYCRTLQGVVYDAPSTVEEFVQIAVQGVQREWVEPIVCFLDDILARFSSEELDAWWLTTPGPLSFHSPGGCKRFLILLRVRLRQPPFSEG